MRISSAAALMAVASMPVFALATQDTTYLNAYFIMGLLVFAKHYANIMRLINGNEPHIGQRCAVKEMCEED